MRTLSFSFDSQMVASASEDLFIDIVSFDFDLNFSTAITVRYMFWANCKLNQLKNGPPVYKLVIQFVNWLAHFQLYETKWSHLETRLNILKTGLKLVNGLQAAWMAWKLYNLPDS